MSLLDLIDYEIEYLHEDLGLLKPNFDHSVAGILPEIIKKWNADLELDQGNYSSYDSFSQLLDDSHPSGYDTIILFLVDGLGVVDLKRIGGFINDSLTENGIIASSCYPTMTSTVMTSIMYGRQPVYHGIVGYNIFNKSLGKVWNALRLRYPVDEERVGEVLKQVELSDLVSGRSFADRITEQDLGISYLVPSFLQPPGLGNILAPIIGQEGYSDHDDLIAKLRAKLQKSVSPQVICVYFPEADGAAHSSGPDSSDYRLSIRYIEKTIQRILKLQEINEGSILCTLTTDHGLSEINPSSVNPMSRGQWRQYKEQGTLLSFSGRTIHAYSTDDNPDSTYHLLEELSDPKRSLIIDGEEAMKLAGGQISVPNLIGDFNVLAADEYMFHVPNSISLAEEEIHSGHHGSLTARELFVPVIIF